MTFAQFLGLDSILYSCDSESFYISIPVDPGLEANGYWIGRKHDLITE